MNAFGYGYVGLMALSGWLAWRRSRSLMHALIAGLFAPFIALIALGALIGHAELQAAHPAWGFIGLVTTLAVLMVVYRN